MISSTLRLSVVLPLLILTGLSIVPSLQGQWADDPVIPRGELFVRLGGSAQAVDELYDPASGERVPLGASLGTPQLGVTEAPQLQPLEDRIRALADAPELAVNLGATRGRLGLDEQVLPLGIGYGVFDRVTVGLTVPFIRKRVDGIVRASPDGANVGRSPVLAEPEGASAFLEGAQEALIEAQAAVQATCEAQGASDPECIEGQALLEEADGFLAEVSSAFTDALPFPLAGSELGGLVQDRWAGLAADLAQWGADAPGAVPLATGPVGSETFRTDIVDGVWPQPGFPLRAPPSFLEIGDVELHLALGILQPTGDEPGFGIRSAVVGTARFPTGQPDSLRHLAPTHPPRGVGGGEVRWITDILLPPRFAVLVVAEGGWHASRDLTLLAPDPSRLFSPDHTRAQVRWQPGSHLRVGLTPRIRLAEAISLGAGWHLRRQRSDAFEPLDPDGPGAPAALPAHTLQSVSLELRYAARHGPLAEAAPLPFELFLRWSRSISATGGAAPVERRIEAGAHFRVWD